MKLPANSPAVDSQSEDPIVISAREMFASSASGENQVVRRIFMTCDAVGGVWTYMAELVRGLTAYGVEVLVAVMGPAPSEQQRAEVADIENVRIVHGDFLLEWEDSPWDSVDAAGDWLLMLASEFEPDIVQLNGYAHATLPWPAPVVVIAHSCVLTWWRAVKREEAPTRFNEYRRRVTEALSSTFVITPTTAFRNQLRHEYNVHLRGLTIHNARSARTVRVGGKERFIFSAGRLWDEAKNVSLLQTIAPSVEWPMYVAGDALVERSDHTSMDNLSLLGRLPSPEVADLMNRAAIYAAPARYEPFGLSILEAALSGCALVLSDVPTLRELWSRGAEFVPPDDPREWRRALSCLISDVARRTRLQRRAREAASAYSVDCQIRGYIRVYRDLAAKADFGRSLVLS
jgi:glycogen(starch) synthase